MKNKIKILNGKLILTIEGEYPNKLLNEEYKIIIKNDNINIVNLKAKIQSYSHIDLNDFLIDPSETEIELTITEAD